MAQKSADVTWIFTVNEKVKEVVPDTEETSGKKEDSGRTTAAKDGEWPKKQLMLKPVIYQVQVFFSHFLWLPVVCCSWSKHGKEAGEHEKKGDFRRFCCAARSFWPVTGISAASDMELSGELQETFQDETEEEEIPIEEQEPEFSEGDSSEFEESPETDFEQDSAEDYFEVITSADQGVIVFEADLLNLEKNSKTDLSEEELQQLQEQEHTFQAGEIVGFYIQPFDG